MHIFTSYRYLSVSVSIQSAKSDLESAVVPESMVSNCGLKGASEFA